MNEQAFGDYMICAYLQGKCLMAVFYFHLSISSSISITEKRLFGGRNEREVEIER